MPLLKSAKERLSDFQKNLIVQSSGTIFSQAIPILASPLLTRLFSPENFGLFGLVVSMSALLAILLSLRVDHGIVVAQSDDEARRIAMVAIVMSVMGAVAFSLVAALSWPLWSDGTTAYFVVWVVLIPGVALLSAAIRTLTLINNRLKRFTSVSRARVFQAVFTAAGSILLGWMNQTEIGLLVALFVGSLVYVAMLLSGLVPFTRVGAHDILDAIRTNGRFVRFSLPADLVNVLSSRLPFIIFPALYGLEQAGYLTLAYRVVGTPARFVGSAIGEVFYSHAAREYEKTGTCWPITAKTAKILLVLGTLGFGALLPLAPTLFGLVFGSEWMDAALYTQILVPAILAGFVVSPLSVVLYIAKRQEIDLVWQVCSFVATGVSCICGLAFGGALGALMLLSASGVVQYAFYFMFIRRYAKARTS